MQKQTKFIVFIIAVIVIIGGIGLYFGLKPEKPGPLDVFAQSLKEKGATFYGAFWCTHCQAQKAEFGSSKKYLPYVECSTPDGLNQTQICIDNKIEGYPTWTFKNELSLTSEKAPLVCEIKTENSAEKKECENRSSKFYKTWIFEDYSFSVKSPTDPIVKGNTFTFPIGALATGEVPLSFLAQQIQFTLPQ